MKQQPRNQYSRLRKPSTIRNAYPDPTNVYVLHRAVVRFTNDDPHDYAIRFFAQGRTLDPGVDLFLPAYESRTLVAGLELKDGQKRDCEYQVIPTAAESIGVVKPKYDAVKKAITLVMRDTKNGGGGTIHVGGN